MSVMFAKEALLNQVTLRDIKEFILVKNLTNVIFARKGLLTQIVLCIIEELTQEKNHMSIYINEHTQYIYIYGKTFCVFDIITYHCFVLSIKIKMIK